MRGDAKIINSQQDAQHVGLTYEQALAAATITVRHDRAVYPDGYDVNLKPGQEGFIEPDYQFEEVVDQAAMQRFGW